MKKIINKATLTINLLVISMAFSDGVGTRGTGNIFRPQTEVTSIQVNRSTAFSVHEMFKSNAALIKNVFNIYISKQQLAFARGAHLKTLTPNSVHEWVSLRAGDLISRLEQTQWSLIHNDDRPNTALEYYYSDENMIEIETSTSSLEAPLSSEDINEALSHFLVSAGAPFSFDEIYSDLLPTIQTLTR